MHANETLDATVLRYTLYAVAVLAVVSLAGFLYLFNFTHFFQMAVPLR